MSKPQDSGHIRSLDGVRGAAVLMVFLYHALSGTLHPTTPIFRFVIAATKTMWIGVDLFFVLSGFLITTILIDARAAQNFYSVFYIRRGLRIFPLYYLVLSVVFLCLPEHYPWSVQIFYWLNLSNLPTAFLGSRHVVGIGLLLQFWSLAIEEQFYLVWPALVHRLRDRSLALISVAVIMTLFMVRNLPFVFVWNLHWPELLYRLTLFRIDTLCGGALLAILALRRPDLLTRRNSLRALFLISAAIFLVSSFGKSYIQPPVIRIGYTSLVVCFTSLVALALFRDSLTSRIFSTSALRLLGRYSYCFYLLHPYVIALGFAVIRHQRLWHIAAHVLRRPVSYNLLAVSLLPFEFAFLLAACALSWRFLEQPLLKLKRHFRYNPRPEHYLA